MRRISAILAALVLCGAAPATTQEPTRGPVAAAAPLVFLDCQDVSCDFEYFQTEITAVGWVRDRAFSDVHILVTGEDTGAGGRAFTVTFIGLGRFAGLTDTLKTALPPSFSDDDRRTALVRLFRAGLVRYVARTPSAKGMIITFAGAEKKDSAGQPRDRWDAWVFNLGFDSFSDGEQTYHSLSVYGNLSADRVTKDWKTHLGVSNSYNESVNKIDDTTSFTYVQRGLGASVLEVKALNEHWSAGIRASINSSMYDNFKSVARITPAIEFDVFPYSQSTRRQVRIEYNVGLSAYSYHDSTIYDKKSEAMPIQRLQVSVSSKEPWGSISLGVQGVHYLTDSSFFRVGANTELSLKVVKNLNLRLFGNYTWIYDQFALAKKNFSQQEILTRQFQRGTTYRYFVGGGMSYTFGSIFNTVVNPRFSGGFFE